VLLQSHACIDGRIQPDLHSGAALLAQYICHSKLVLVTCCGWLGGMVDNLPQRAVPGCWGSGAANGGSTCVLPVHTTKQHAEDLNSILKNTARFYHRNVVLRGKDCHPGRLDQLCSNMPSPNKIELLPRSPCLKCKHAQPSQCVPQHKVPGLCCSTALFDCNPQDQAFTDHRT
jgi:hypothetical protein